MSETSEQPWFKKKKKLSLYGVAPLYAVAENGSSLIRSGQGMWGLLFTLEVSILK